MACLILLAGLHQPAFARPQAQISLPMQVMINEVAWGGTRANSTHEWVELYNPSTSSGSIDLNGWTLDILTTPGGSPLFSIDLSGHSIPNGGYFLMERFEVATTVPADLVYDSGIDLADGGMVLQLRKNGALQDSANANGGSWPAGSASSGYCSMERVPGQQDADIAWQDNCTISQLATADGGLPLAGTPRSANLTVPFTPVPTDTPTPDLTQVYPHGAVIINEIAWMGTLANRSSEWLELYNPGAAEIDLNGWVLRSMNGPLWINLSGKIKPGGYFLLERNDDTAVKDIPADQIYTNTIPLVDYPGGEYLQLKAPDGSVIDTANQQNGPWPAGNYASACSMERGGPNLPDVLSSWLTNTHQYTSSLGFDNGGNRICGTPRSQNWAWSVTPTATFSPTPTRTPYPPYMTLTPTKTPKKSPTPTRNPFAPTPSSIVINEFLPQPRSDWNGDGQINTGDEFIEIINLGANAVLLNNWTLDDQPGDSNPYNLGNLTIQPKARLVFFSSKTGILLSSGGDTVRLIQPNARIADAFTYGVVRNPDQTWCRLPDGGQTWVFGCAPTITTANRIAQSVIVGNRVEASICLSNKLPPGVQMAECDTVGLAAWDGSLWEYQPPHPRYMDAGTDIYILD